MFHGIKREKFRLHIEVDDSDLPQKHWIIYKPDRVTVGYSPEALISLPDARLNPVQRVFFKKGHELRLVVTPNLKGHLNIGGKAISLAAIREVGLIRSDRDREYVLLKEKTSGALTIGHSTLRFWVTTPSEDPDFPRHPFLQRWKDGFPVLLILALILSTGLHVSGLRFLSGLPTRPEPSIEDLGKRISRIMDTRDPYVRQKIEKFLPENRARTGGEQRQMEDRGGNKRMPAAQGFLAAVEKSSRSPKSEKSPFAALFSTEVLGKDLEEALAGRSLEEAVSQALRTGSTTGGTYRPGTKDAPGTIDIGEVGGGEMAEANLELQTGGPQVARFAMGPSEIEGSLDQRALQNLMNQRSGSIQDCYERALARKPDLAGKMVFALKILTDGKPGDIRIEVDQVGDSGLRRCLVERMSGWVFPRPTGGATTVRFPFIFSSSARG